MKSAVLRLNEAEVQELQSLVAYMHKDNDWLRLKDKLKRAAFACNYQKYNTKQKRKLKFMVRLPEADLEALRRDFGGSQPFKGKGFRTVDNTKHARSDEVD